jgi:mRNA-degrading endonuclease RelE of RelBE toxin-antitoxin system
MTCIQRYKHVTIVRGRITKENPSSCRKQKSVSSFIRELTLEALERRECICLKLPKNSTRREKKYAHMMTYGHKIQNLLFGRCFTQPHTGIFYERKDPNQASHRRTPNDRSHRFWKPLRYSLKEHRRLRVADYRGVYRVDASSRTVTVIAIKHRRDIYERH